jgi:hypothetical protein
MTNIPKLANNIEMVPPKMTFIAETLVLYRCPMTKAGIIKKIACKITNNPMCK